MTFLGKIAAEFVKAYPRITLEVFAEDQRVDLVNGGYDADMGDITELGRIVAAAFEHPDLAGDGAYLPLVGDCLSFGEIVGTLNSQAHRFTFNQVPPDVFAHFFPGADELAQMFGYFERDSYLGGDWQDRIAAANRLIGTSPTDFATWARSNMRAEAQTSSANAAA